MASLTDMPPKQCAVLGDSSIEYVLAGSGSPTILLINGGDGPIEGWYKILPELSAASRVLAYNRCGIGRSSKPVEPQTSEVVARQLRELLAQLALSPPYLIVGHSLGGLHANLFARSHPDDVCGMALLEATAPGDVALMAAHRTTLQRRLQGFADLLFGTRPLSEASNAAASAAMVEKAGAFPQVPLTVITGGSPALARLMPAAAREGRAKNQRELSRLSAQGQQIIAPKSGHFPQLSEPQLVLSAIVRMLDEIRERPTS